MSIRSINIAPRAFLGFAFIAVLVIGLGFFSLNRMAVIRQATTDMETNELPSVGFLGNMLENTLRLRITSFRTLVNREPAALRETDTRIAELIGKLQDAKRTMRRCLPRAKSWRFIVSLRRRWRLFLMCRRKCWTCRVRKNGRHAQLDQHPHERRHRPDGCAA